jgi:hypothetical protein
MGAETPHRRNWNKRSLNERILDLIGKIDMSKFGVEVVNEELQHYRFTYNRVSGDIGPNFGEPEDRTTMDVYKLQGVLLPMPENWPAERKPGDNIVIDDVMKAYRRSDEKEREESRIETLGYVCETGLTGLDLFNFLKTEVYTDIPDMDNLEYKRLQKQMFVEEFVRAHGDAFGTTYNEISQQLKAHMEEDEGCKKFYDEYRPMAMEVQGRSVVDSYERRKKLGIGE